MGKRGRMYISFALRSNKEEECMTCRYDARRPRCLEKQAGNDFLLGDSFIHTIPKRRTGFQDPRRGKEIFLI